MNKLFDMSTAFADQMTSHVRIYNIVLVVNIFLYFLVISVCISADTERLKLFSYKWTYREESKDWQAIEVSNAPKNECSQKMRTLHCIRRKMNNCNLNVYRIELVKPKPGHLIH
jgi:hypothetical protein